MTKSSATRKINAKCEEWDKVVLPVNRFFKRAYKEVKYNVTNWLDWYFGDERVESVKKWLRRLIIILIDLSILKVFGVI